jgi:hypothetical protein
LRTRNGAFRAEALIPRCERMHSRVSFGSKLSGKSSTEFPRQIAGVRGENQTKRRLDLDAEAVVSPARGADAAILLWRVDPRLTRGTALEEVSRLALDRSSRRFRQRLQR